MMRYVLALRDYIGATRKRMLLSLVAGAITQAISIVGVRHVALWFGASRAVADVASLAAQMGCLALSFWLVKPAWQGKTAGLHDAAGESSVKAVSRISAFFLAGDRYTAWLYRTESKIRQEDIDRLDWLVGSTKGRLLVAGWFIAFVLLACLLAGVRFPVFHVQLGWQMPEAELAALAGLGGALLAACLGWLVVDVWVGFRKYVGKMQRFLWINLLVMLVAGIAAALGASADKHGAMQWKMMAVASLATLPICMAALLLMGVVVAMVSHLRNREFLLERDKLRAEAERAARDTALARAELKLLQAQIEPHFLFNTLAAAQHRAEDTAPEAAALLADLIHFLRGSMGALREEHTTLARDGELVRAYLAVMQARLGARLQFQVDIPPALGGQTIPTLMLLTLVENALKHGIEPHPPGGEVVLRAEAQDDELHLTVADTGRGVSDLAGSGVGLENIRTRLRLMYGERAGLLLAENVPQGFVATLCLPLQA